MEPVYSLALCKNIKIVMRLKSGVYHLQVIYLQLSENSDRVFIIIIINFKTTPSKDIRECFK